MIIKAHKIGGVYEIMPEPRVDERGFFMRTYDRKIFSDKGIDRDWVQENHSCSVKKGIIRGLHFQLPPYAETKLIRAVKGAVFDVFVDIRENSETLGQWGYAELSEENKKLLLIPRGFAHGFCTLTAESEVIYKVDNYYKPEAECGIIWNDAKLKITWPGNDPILSDRDAVLGTFSDFLAQHGGIKI